MRPARPPLYGEISSLVACAILVVGGLAGHPDGLRAQDAAPAERRVVLTFDDVPVSGTCDAQTIRQVTTHLTATLVRRGAPSAALVTPIECVGGELLEETLSRWRDAGATIGNHSFSHLDLNGTPVAAYVEDVARAQERIDRAIGQTERWFRPPYLHSGDEAGKKRAVAAYLQTHDYRIAPVTIDNQEWVYAGVYHDAVQSGDDALAGRVAADYLRHVEASVAFYEELSRAVLGREIPQILLLHANRLNADHLDAVIDLLAGRGYDFVSLEAAMSDPAYARDDPYLGTRGLSWIQRWALDEEIDVPDEPREHPWVARELQRIRRAAEEDEASAAAGNDSAAAAIAMASRAFSSAYVAGDTATIRELYTEDAVLLPPGGEVRGRDAIGRYFGPSARRENVSHAMESTDLRIRGRTAIDAGTWHNTIRIDGGPEREASGRYLVVWTRGEDGRWRIEYDVWHRP